MCVCWYTTLAKTKWTVTDDEDDATSIFAPSPVRFGFCKVCEQARRVAGADEGVRLTTLTDDSFSDGSPDRDDDPTDDSHHPRTPRPDESILDHD